MELVWLGDEAAHDPLLTGGKALRRGDFGGSKFAMDVASNAIIRLRSGLRRKNLGVNFFSAECDRICFHAPSI